MSIKPIKQITATFSRKSLLWTLFITGFWLFLWFAPWQSLLAFSIWFQLGLALLIFIIPGLCLYGLIRSNSSGWLNSLTFGFVISHLLLAVFGTTGRFMHFPFAVLRYGMLALSLILLLLYAIPKLDAIRLPRINLSTTGKILSYWPLILMMVMAGLMTIQRTLSDDDLSYLAYLTNWQNSSALNFNDVFFGVDKLTMTRFWLVSTAFSQAYLSELSGLPGIFVVGGYYEPFLAALSLCCIYELARTLGLSQYKAMVAVIFQLMFLALLSEYLHPGAPFLRQLSTDKATATYIFVPVFLQSVVWYFNKPAKENIFLVLLTGLSLMIMHPVALVFAIMVAGAMTLFGLNQSNLRARFVLLILLVLIMSPQIVLRFLNTEAQGAIPYSMEDILSSRGIETMILVWHDTPFYGYNPSSLAMHIPYAEKLPAPLFVLQYVWLVFPILGVWFAARHIRHDLLSQYILACFLLGALAGIPFTGWLLGKLVSAWSLERTLWLYPYGIGTVFSLLHISDRIGFTNRLQGWTSALQARTKIDSYHWVLATLTVLSAIVLLPFMREQNLPNLTRFASNAERYKEFSQIGEFMDNHTIGQSVAVGTDRLNDYIPAISSKAKIISYRPADPSYPYFYSQEERDQRLADRQSIFSRSITVEDRIALIRKYDVQFLWLRGGEYYTVKDLLSTFPDIFIEHKIGGYYLIEVLPVTY